MKLDYSLDISFLFVAAHNVFDSDDLLDISDESQKKPR